MISIKCLRVTFISLLYLTSTTAHDDRVGRNLKHMETFDAVVSMISNRRAQEDFEENLSPGGPCKVASEWSEKVNEDEYDIMLYKWLKRLSCESDSFEGVGVDQDRNKISNEKPMKTAVDDKSFETHDDANNEDKTLDVVHTLAAHLGDSDAVEEFGKSTNADEACKIAYKYMSDGAEEDMSMYFLIIQLLDCTSDISFENKHIDTRAEIPKGYFSNKKKTPDVVTSTQNKNKISNEKSMKAAVDDKSFETLDDVIIDKSTRDILHTLVAGIGDQDAAEEFIHCTKAVEGCKTAKKYMSDGDEEDASMYFLIIQLLECDVE